MRARLKGAETMQSLEEMDACLEAGAPFGDDAAVAVTSLSARPVQPQNRVLFQRRALLAPPLSPGSYSISAHRALKRGLLVTAGGKGA